MMNRYRATVLHVHSAWTVEVEISLGFGVKIGKRIRIKGVPDRIPDDLVDKAKHCLINTVVNRTRRTVILDLQSQEGSQIPATVYVAQIKSPFSILVDGVPHLDVGQLIEAAVKMGCPPRYVFDIVRQRE